MLTRGGTVRIQIHSSFDMLDFVQVASDHVGQIAGLDEDSVHWISVAVRESVINAIKHGNRNDESKHVFVEFEADPDAAPELAIEVDPTTGGATIAVEPVAPQEGAGLEPGDAEPGDDGEGAS